MKGRDLIKELSIEDLDKEIIVTETKVIRIEEDGKEN